MRQTTSIAAALIVLLAGACKKDDHTTPLPPPPPVKIDVRALSLSTRTPHAGDTLFVRGRNLGTDASRITFVFSDTIYLPAYQAKDSIVSVILPPVSRFRYYGIHPTTLAFHLPSADYSEKFPISFLIPEPKGWFSLYKTSPFYVSLNPQTNIGSRFFSDSVGFLHSGNTVWKTWDGGGSWTIRPGTSAYALAAIDSLNCWTGGVNFISSTTDGGKNWVGHTLESKGGVIYSMAQYSPTSGHYMTLQNGFYAVSGGFDTNTQIKLEYKTQYSFSLMMGFSAIDKDNLLIIEHAEMPSGGRLPAAIVKTAGVYDEYVLPGSNSNQQLWQVQLVNPLLGFAVDSEDDIWKYTGDRKWTLLSQKGTAVHFVNTMEGYTADATSIYKTTDGGNSWTPVFALQPGDLVANISSYKGKLWVMGNNDAKQTGFVYKYNL